MADSWAKSFATWDTYKAARKTADDLWHSATVAYNRGNRDEYTRLLDLYRQAVWYADQCYLAHLEQRREDTASE